MSEIIYRKGGDSEEFYEWQEEEDDSEDEDSDEDYESFSIVDLTSRIDQVIHLQSVSLIMNGIIAGCILMAIFFSRLDR